MKRLQRVETDGVIAEEQDAHHRASHVDHVGTLHGSDECSHADGMVAQKHDAHVRHGVFHFRGAPVS